MCTVPAVPPCRISTRPDRSKPSWRRPARRCSRTGAAAPSPGGCRCAEAEHPTGEGVPGEGVPSPGVLAIWIA
jgi:hypothetical protein